VTEQSNALQRLIDWKFASKSHVCKISHDDGYGASCWVVELWIGNRHIYCSEAGGLPATGDRFCLYNDEDECEWQDWPGLEATINAAIDRAEAKA